MNVQAISLVIGALVGVVLLIGGAARLFQSTKLFQSRGWMLKSAAAGRKLCVQESIALDPRRRLHLVQCGNRQVVLLTGGAQDLVIGWMQDP